MPPSAQNTIEKPLTSPTFTNTCRTMHVHKISPHSSPVQQHVCTCCCLNTSTTTHCALCSQRMHVSSRLPPTLLYHICMIAGDARSGTVASCIVSSSPQCRCDHTSRVTVRMLNGLRQHAHCFGPAQPPASISHSGIPSVWNRRRLKRSNSAQNREPLCVRALFQ